MAYERGDLPDEKPPDEPGDEWVEKDKPPDLRLPWDSWDQWLDDDWSNNGNGNGR